MPGLSFLATSAYTSLPADISAVTDPDFTDFTYPYVFGNGVTGGWVGGPGSMRARDRDNTVDVRVRGMHFNATATAQVDFRIDLASSGTKNINIAVGSPTDATTDDYVLLLDTSTSLGTLVDKASGHSTGHFIDATNVDLASAAAWVSSNTAASKTFSTTQMILRIGRGGTSGGSPLISHVFWADAGGGGGGLPFFMQSDLKAGYISSKSGGFN